MVLIFSGISDFSNSGVIYYLIVQRTISTGILAVIVYKGYIGLDYNFQELLSLKILLACKLGLSPLHFWVFKIRRSEALRTSNFISLLTVIKLPVFYGLYIIDFNMAMIAIFNRVFSSGLIYFVENFRHILVIRSLANFLFFFFYLTFSFGFFHLTFLIYSFSIMVVFFLIGHNYFNSPSLSGIEKSWVSFLFVAGLLPTAIFAIKVLFLNLGMLFNNFGFVYLFNFWIFYFLTFIGYYKYLYFELCKRGNFNVSIAKNSKTTISVLLFISVLILLFF